MQKKRKQITVKILLARARESDREYQRRECEAREKEDREWREAEVPKSRATIKREEKKQRRAEKVSKKAEARGLAIEEEKELERSLNRIVKRVTALDLLRQKEEEQAAMIRRLEEEKNKPGRSLKGYEYKNIIMVTNNNRDDSVIDARSVSDALAQLTSVDDLPRHPERRFKASYTAFEKAEIERLKEDKPNLTLGQYIDMSWKQWKKSPDNPLRHMKINYPRLDKRLKTSGRIIGIVDDAHDFSVV